MPWKARMNKSAEKIKVAILEDHPVVIDGYLFRLSNLPDIEITAYAYHGNELDSLLEKNTIDVLILDIEVKMSEYGTEYLNTLALIPLIYKRFPEIKIIISTMHNYWALANRLFEKGVSGYILKDDYEITENLAQVVRDVHAGEMVISETIDKQMKKVSPGPMTLTRRELEILAYFFHNPDIETPEIAEAIGIADSTVRNILAKLYRKLGVNSKNAAITKVKQMGYSTNHFPIPAPLNPSADTTPLENEDSK